jgi:hypothetical protein
VLDIVRRPESFGRFVVAFVEKRIECLQHERFVGWGRGINHKNFLNLK